VARSAANAAQRSSLKRARQSSLVSEARAGISLPPTSLGAGLGWTRVRMPLPSRSGVGVGSRVGAGPSSSSRSFWTPFRAR
jgi:hypothetical protein